MTRLLLLRHGLTDPMSEVLCGRMPGVHLNAEGKRQAQLLRSAINTRYNVAQIVSSPLERARETAAIVQENTNVGFVDIDDDLIELEYGHWTGTRFRDIRNDETWEHYNRSRSLAAPPGGESLMQVQIRAWRAVERIVSRNAAADRVVVVVSHGDVIRSLVVLFIGAPLDYIHRFEIAPASLSEVHCDRTYGKIVSLNQKFY